MRALSIACLGTSLTYDDVWQGGGEWPGIVQNALTAATDRNIAVYNFGVSGQDSRQRLAEVVAGMYLPSNPDIIIVEFCTNDALTSRSMTLAESKSNTLSIISQFKTQNPACKAFLMTMNPCVAGSGPALDRPSLSSYFQQYRDMVAADPTLGLIDNTPSWGTPTYTQIPDGCHPIRSAENPIIAPNIVAALRPFV